MIRVSVASLVAGSLALAPLGCVRYQPSPLDPGAHVAEYRARRLDDPSLRAWVTAHAGAPEGDRWTDAQLAVAALAFRADLERGRRDWLAARAGTAAAGARPAPGAEVEVERAVGGAEGDPPWVVSLAGLFTVELGGKQAARLQAARAREAAAEAELALVLAGTLRRVRDAAMTLAHAEGAQRDAGAAVDALRRVEDLERARYAEAALGSGEVARTAADVAAARSDAAAAERDAVLARADLAGTLAVPAAEVRALAVAPPTADGCVWGEAIGADSLAAHALVRRAEVARALASYAAAEAEVRARVAERYPDLALGPGFIWDQGVSRWTLALALPGLLALRARGPVTAAEAARHAAAARVAEAPADIVAQTARAVEGCRGAAHEVAVADSRRVAADRVAALSRAGYDRGETGRLELARAELLLTRAASATLAARRRLERAGLALEQAAAEWRGAGPVRWPDPRAEVFIPREEER
ncbi:MAG TPA: TolC family protein [Gemmatimonadales bacterium]|nr:TolC family protein [Gemmatimonadales bacterium]